MSDEAARRGDIPRLLIDAVLSNRDEAMLIVHGADIAEANDELLRLTGSKREEIVGQPYRAFFSPASSAMVDEQIARLVAGEQVNPSQIYEVIRSDGNTMLLEALVLGWASDRLVNVILLRDVTRREETFSALKESEKLYRVLAENIPAGIVMSRPSGRTLYVNQRLVEMTGYSTEELMAPIWFVHPDDTEALELCELAFTGRKASPLHETRIITKDGRERWVSVLFLPLQDPDGQFDVVLTVWQDITDRKLAEERLYLNERFLQTVFDSIQDGISVSDTKLEILSANQWMETTYGHKMPLRGRKCYEAFRGRQEPCEQCPSLRAMETRLPQMELWPFYNAGHERAGWVELRAFPLSDDKGEILGVIEYIRDVTASKLAEERLREAEERFRLLAENASDIIWEMGTDGILTYVSPAVRRYGYTRDDWIGSSVDPFLHSDEVESYRQAFLSPKDHTVPRRYEVRLIGKDGRAFWMEVLVDSVLREGIPVKLQAIARDITERKATEEALRAAHERLAQAYKLQGEFLNNVTHEVRTPLTAVQGYARMLLDGLAGSLNKEQSGLLSKALAASENLLAVVDSVLEVTRLRSGRIDLRPVVCKPWRLATKAVSVVLPQAQFRGIEIGVASPDHDCAGVYDRQKLMLILVNLLSNAVKFTETGSVRVAVECGPSGAEFIVTDTGVGIDSDDVPAVFEEFVQGADRRKHKPQGFGVGLALVAALVPAIGGTLILSSSPGLGTAITLYVPVLDAP